MANIQTITILKFTVLKIFGFFRNFRIFLQVAPLGVIVMELFMVMLLNSFAFL